MDQEAKDRHYAEAQAHVDEVRSHIVAVTDETEASIRATEEKLRGPVRPGLDVERRLYEHKRERLAELVNLQSAPYFFRCDVRFEGETAEKTVYFSKHPFSDDAIYSWASPAAALRFEQPGQAQYAMPDGSVRSVGLNRKDQYLIADARIIFMATEDVATPRTLIHQEHFTRRKRGFVLPDIVAQMEKAQDQVIRAPYEGSFLIAGPAGSGKTTLALHRVAYLAQNPDTAPHFPHEEIMVFVQNESSKAYFGALLAELGIRRAGMSTFHEWALRLLKIEDHGFVTKWSDDDREDDDYFFAKKKALASFSSPDGRGSKENAHDFLSETFGPHFSGEQRKKFEWQRKEKKLDRFDLALLLRRQIDAEGRLRQDVEYYDKIIRGKLRKIKTRNSVQYALIIVDEAENWLAEELTLVRGCLSPQTQAIIYVGDLAQQTQFGTIRSWEDAGERFEPERRVVLHKVYRNTRQILEFVRGRGYQVEIPDGIASGPEVQESRFKTADEEMENVRRAVDAVGGEIVGILAKRSSRLAAARQVFSAKENVKIFTINEAQGLEFDTVILLGADEFDDAGARNDNPALLEERKRVDRDLFYVALTRAMRGLHLTSVASGSRGATL